MLSCTQLCLTMACSHRKGGQVFQQRKTRLFSALVVCGWENAAETRWPHSWLMHLSWNRVSGPQRGLNSSFSNSHTIHGQVNRLHEDIQSREFIMTTSICSSGVCYCSHRVVMPEMKWTNHMIMPISQSEENTSGVTADAETPGQSSLRHGSPGSADEAVSL